MQTNFLKLIKFLKVNINWDFYFFGIASFPNYWAVNHKENA